MAEKIILLDLEGKPVRTIHFSNLSTDEFRRDTDMNTTEDHIDSEQWIHADDSISTIKKKIIQEMPNVSYDEIYLFGYVEKMIRLDQIFDSVVDESRILSSSKFSQLIIHLNIDPEVLQILPKKTEYTYDDLLLVDLHLKSHSIAVPIGKQFSKQDDAMFSANPFDMIPGSEYLPIEENPLISFENQVLLNTTFSGGQLVDRAIYLCLAEDVFTYFETNRINMNTTGYYFPLLFKQKIMDIQSLQLKKPELLKKTKKAISKEFTRQAKVVDSMYNLYRTNQADIHDKVKYENVGIESFSLILHPVSHQTLPLESIFKNVHATIQTPFIKYNPGPRRENIYRFYSEQITRTGIKIPFLGKNTITHLYKQIGKNKEISFYLPISNHPGEKVELYINLTNNGNIQIYGAFEKGITIAILEQLIVDHVNPVIQHVNNFLFQSGFEIIPFQRMNHPCIEITHVKYIGIIPIEKNIHFPDWWGCLSILYDNPDDTFELESGLHLRYKRVENYQEMEEESTIISELFKQTNHEREIMDTLVAHYHISEEEAILKIAQFFDKFTRIQGKYVNKNMDIVENPGFPVEMRINSFESKLYISIDHIISMDYIPVLQIYMDIFIYMTQFMKKSPKKLCEKPAIKLKPSDHIENLIMVEPVKTRVQVQPIQFRFQREDSEYEEKDPFLFDRDQDEMGDETPNIMFDRDEDESSPIESEQESPIESINENAQESPIESINENAQESPSPNILFDRDEDEQEASSADTDSTISPIGQMKGGGPKKVKPVEIEQEEDIPGYELEQYKKKIDGMALTENNNNLFLNRLKKREPTLFLEKTEGNFDRYSRLCLSNYNRQPIILTDQEKERIDREHPGSYKHSISYGTDPKKKFHYICPRYWCLLTQTSLTEEEVQESIKAEERAPGSSKCGKIIPKNAKKIPKGHYIYEFDHPKQHRDNKTGEYIENAPGFLHGDAHPAGFCLPCCFKKPWESKSQKTRREQCAQNDSDANTSLLPLPKLQREYSYRTSHYIVGIDKMVVPQSRWGFLPYSAQYFLQSNNADSVTANNTAVIRPDAFPLLRFGVEQNPRKSFIGCIADAYATQHKLLQVPSIEEMCKILGDSITLDQYIRLHNGSIVAIFRTMENVNHDNYEKYRDTSQFVKEIISDIELTSSKEEFLIYTVASYENFQAFLLNPDSIINHTFLWDIICTANPQLFPIGLNLAIMEIVDADNTENIQLLCPSISYSSAFYDEKKPTFLLLKRDVFYEPVYTYTHNTDDPRSLFVEATSPSPLKRTLHIIRKTTQKYCSPQPSIPDVYHLKRSHIGSITLSLLKKHGYQVEQQVLNYQGRVIGFMVDRIMVPTYPSAVETDISMVFMDEDLWQDYETTRDGLFAIYRKTNGEIPCKPIVKIEEDDLVVGILTETDQFIQIDAPVAPIDDGLRSINGTNYMTADKDFVLTNSEDKMKDEREDTVKRIRLEEQFYSAFRTMVRVLINDFDHRTTFQDLLRIIENQNMRYRAKLRVVEEMLKTISKKHVNFVVSGKDIDFLAFHEITACRPGEDKQYCLLENGIIQIQIPKQHLFPKPDGTFTDNETTYYKRLADELIRYKRIQSFMLESNIRVPVTSYSVFPNEIIMLQSLLTAEYFASLVPYNQIKNITFDMVNPRTSQIYSNIISLDEQFKLVGETLSDAVQIDCIKGEPRELEGNKQNFWRRIFPLHTQEYVYNNSPICTFYVFIDIMLKLTHIPTNMQMKTFSVMDLKQILIESYKTFMEKGFQKAIAEIWRLEGKRKMFEEANGGIDAVIASDEYYMTNLDMWIIADHLNLPIVLFTTSKISSFFIGDQTTYAVNWIAMESRVKEHIRSAHFFIRGHSKRMKLGEIPTYSVVTTPFTLNNVKGIEGMIKSGLSNPESEYRNNIIGISDYFAMRQMDPIPGKRTLGSFEDEE